MPNVQQYENDFGYTPNFWSDTNPFFSGSEPAATNIGDTITPMNHSTFAIDPVLLAIGSNALDMQNGDVDFAAFTQDASFAQDPTAGAVRLQLQPTVR
jgi:hypothetical protein